MTYTVAIGDLGGCSKIIANKDDTILLNGKGRKHIRWQLGSTDSTHRKEKLEDWVN